MTGESGSERSECITFECPDICAVSTLDDQTKINCAAGRHHILPFQGHDKKHLIINGTVIKYKEVSELNFKDNELGDECWPAIIEMASNSGKLREICLDGNNFTYIPSKMLEAMKKVFIHIFIHSYIYKIH